MAFETPDFSPDLVNLLKLRQNPLGVAPGEGPVRQPGMPGAPPATTGMPIGGLRTTQMPAPYAPPATTLPASGAKLPQPTDDPAVAPMQKPPDVMQYLTPAMKQMNEDLAGYRTADQANRINPQAVKPRLWERLVGFGLGATQLRNPENAGNVAGEVVNRRRNAAELARSTALAPWTQRLEQDRQSLPAYRDVAETAGKQADLNLKTHQENRETWSAQQQAQWHDDEAEIRKMYDEGRIKDAEDRINELAERNKNDELYKNKLLDLRGELLKLQQEKLDKGKDHTAQSTSAETQKANSLRAAHTAYAKATQGLPTDPNAPWTDEQKGQLQQAQDAYHQAAQEAEDAYEAKVAELGGSMTHQDVTTDWAKSAGKPKPAPAGGKTETKTELPTQYGPKGEKPVGKQGTDGQGRRYGYYKSTGQWMLVPTENKQ